MSDFYVFCFNIFNPVIELSLLLCVSSLKFFLKKTLITDIK